MQVERSGHRRRQNRSRLCDPFRCNGCLLFDAKPLLGAYEPGEKEAWMFLADLFTLDMNIGSGFFRLAIDLGKDRAFADLLTITVSLAGYTITYNLVDFLIILGISIVAAVIVEKLMHQTTPGGFFGAFLIA